MPSLQTGKGASLPALLPLHRCDVPTKTPPTQDHCVSHCEPSRWSNQWLLQVHKWPIDWMSLPFKTDWEGPIVCASSAEGSNAAGQHATQALWLLHQLYDPLGCWTGQPS